MSFWTRKQTLGLAAGLLGGSILLSRLMGLVRDKVISYLFGATPEADIYFAAFVIPDFINYLLAGGYFAITLIPLLAARFRDDAADGWRLFSAVFWWVIIGISTLTAGALWAAPALAHFAAPGLPPAGLVRLTLFLRIVLPAQIFFLAGACLNALLYLRRQFLVPALCPLVYNFMIIAGGVLGRGHGMEGFCWGVLAGSAVGNFGLPWLAARQGAGLHLQPVFRHPGLRRFGALALPLMLGQSIVVWDEQLVRIFGSLAGPGAVSWLNYARRLMMVPVGAVAQAAGVAAFPFLAELAARREFDRLQATLRTALRHVALLLVPLSAWLIVAAAPAVTLIFQQGRFGPADAAATAGLLRILMPVACVWGLQQLLGRAFYAQQDTLTPVVLGTLGTLAALPLFALGAHLWGAPGVAAASALSVALYALGLGLVWRRRMGGAAFEGLGGGLARAVALSAAACAPALAVQWPMRTLATAHPLLAALTALAASAACFVAAYGVLAARLAPDLVAPVVERLRRWRAKGAATRGGQADPRTDGA